MNKLQGAFARKRTFLWFCCAVVGMMTRFDLAGVTSIIRVLGICPIYYDRLLDFFHSKSTNLNMLAQLWTKCVIEFGLGYKINNRLLIIGDGTKIPKEGKKMPAVKSLHQESESNSKPEYIMGHSCQALALCVTALQSFFAIPLISRIHEGVVLSNRDTKTLYDKMEIMLNSLNILHPYYFVGDAYYACRKMVVALLKNNNHLITRVRSNSVAFEQLPEQKNKKRGRPKKYGKKIYLRKLFKERKSEFAEAIHPTDQTKVKLLKVQLIWRSIGIPVAFLLVIHPVHCNTIFMTTDLSLTEIQILQAYGLRFRIEIAFRQAIHTIGTFAYHFWMRAMTPISRGSGDQYLHKKTKKHRDAVARKINAYNLHMQIGVIAQGMLQFISATADQLVWSSFHSWIRTIRPGISPSEAVTATALRNSLPYFLADSLIAPIFTKFILDKLDPYISKHLKVVNSS